MKILALDIAGVTGVAVGETGGDPKAWAVDIGKRLSENRRFANIIRLTSDLIETHSPDLVVCEAPIGGKQASAYLIGLEACVRGAATQARVKCRSLTIGPVRKHFLGKHYTVRHFPALKTADAKGAIKKLVVDRCKMLGWDVSDDNAADACAVWDYAMANYSKEHQAKPLGGLFRG